MMICLQQATLGGFLLPALAGPAAQRTEAGHQGHRMRTSFRLSLATATSVVSVPFRALAHFSVGPFAFLLWRF